MTTTVLNEIGNDAGTPAQLNDSTATNTGKAFEIGYLGDLGVKGLTAQAFFTSGDKVNEQHAADKEVKTLNLGLSYNVGAITVSVAQIKTEGLQNGHAAASTNVANGNLAEELKGKSVGIAYAASKDLTFGLAYATADSDAVLSIEDEKTTIASVGYSLGAVGIKAQIANVDSFAGLAANDGKMARVLMFTSF
jgi:hypothetical protein